MTAVDVQNFGPTLIIAPHPDDETLGCGGTIALLRQCGVPVRVLVISDGAGSHPASKRFPAPRLIALRRAESLTALDRLGVLPPNVTFLLLPDGHVPTTGKRGFGAAIERCVTVFESFRPQTVLVPWRRDPHADHRASWELASVAAIRVGCQARWLEYPVWLWDSNRAEDNPRSNEVDAYRLDITQVLPLKRRALQAYRSQLSNFIDDDPGGFRLSASMLTHFDKPWETFFSSDFGFQGRAGVQ